MNEIMIKEFDGNKVEIIEINGQVLFNPYDVGKCLELAEGTVRDHISKFNSKQVVKLKNSVAGSTNIRKLNNAGENFLTESGVYKLVFKSRKPDAEKFTDWVTDEVLPSILKHGTYMTDKVLANTLDDPDFIISLATKLKEERLAKQKLAQQIEELKPKAEYLDNILENQSLILVKQIAKDYGMSAIKFNRMLKDLKVQYKANEQWVLYSPYDSEGYAHSRTYKPQNSENVYMNTEWTQKGRLFLYHLLKQNGILPSIERVKI